MPTAPDPMDAPFDIVSESAVTIPDAASELAALRGVALHNMRLLKVQIVPLIEAALRSASGPVAGSTVGAQSRRWTATAVRLIDDTSIAAATAAGEGALATLDLNRLVRDVVRSHQDCIGPVVLGKLPTVLARADYMRLLVSELLTAIAWIGPRQLPHGLRVDSARSTDRQVVIWFQDAELAPPDLGALEFNKGESDRIWSLSRNLIARMGAGFFQSRHGQGRLCLAIRLPEDMIQADGAGQVA